MSGKKNVSVIVNILIFKRKWKGRVNSLISIACQKNCFSGKDVPNNRFSQDYSVINFY